MTVGMTIMVLALIICLTILLAIYINACADNGIKMFANPRYDERITELEKTIKELKEGK